MKFLCDRCKTRYSIGDERVRGKILKIRCKNCANVITVREGMEVADDPARTKRSTTMAPPPVVSAAPPASKPPPALHEEWYVSIEGAQEGPFSLSEAQSWVAAKGRDADLHCWSEGFDDWLPVDKVSHFRGLRAKPPGRPSTGATTPPPIPKAATAGRIAAPDASPAARAAGGRVESEPKPLFAATMASLRGGAAATPPGGLGIPSIPKTSATPPVGTPARATPPPAGSAPANGVSTSRPLAKVANTPPPGAAPGPFAHKAPTFDVGPTEVEPEPFGRKREASASPDPATTVDPFAAALSGSSSPKPAAPPTDDDDLAIGEVSRVVNLADLAKSKRASGPVPIAGATGSSPAIATRGSAARIGGGTGAVPRLGQTGMVPRLGQTGPVPRVEDPGAAGASSVDAATPSPQTEATHRKHFALLIGGAILLLAAVVTVLVLVVSGESVTNDTLAGADQIDTTRPDDPLRPKVTTGPSTDPTMTSRTQPGTNRPRNPGQSITQNPRLDPGPEVPTTGSLRSDEIEDMARKYSMSTQRCYMRSQKGAEAILIGDIKKIQATLDITADGTVRDVRLSEHADTNLGKCLISTIRSWKFRTSPGGMFKISLQFVAG